MMMRKVRNNEMQIVKTLFLAYAEEHELDLCFQNFDQELAELPGVYAEPKGSILVWEDENQTIQAIVALKKLDSKACEMKRLYVRPSFRKKGIGRQLIISLLNVARKKNYKEMKLDTLDELKDAIRLYETMGFVETEAYNKNPNASMRYFKKTL